jgi:sirohydrochlorin ferrochelatase
MKALLVMAHGSPRPEANADIERVVQFIRDREAYPVVILGYLDCNEPDIPAAIDLCVEAGATQLFAVPYFLHSGRHFLIDLPELLAGGERRHPGVTIRMGDYIGHQPQIADILRDRVSALKLPRSSRTR